MARDLGHTLRNTIDRDAMVSFLHRALSYPSTQTDLLEDDPKIAQFIRDVIAPEAHALSPDTLRTDSKGNLIAVWGSGEPALAIMVYAMTHPQTIMTDPFSPTVVDGTPFGAPGPCMRGRGACEQKGALAAVIGGVRTALEGWPRPPRPLALVAVTAGETGRPYAIHHLLGELNANFESAIIACGTQNQICLAQKGRIDVDITIRGKQSHSSMPWLGLNALEGASTVLERLKEHKVLGEHPQLGPITLTPTALATFPQATHTVPGVARIRVDYRLSPGDDPDAALETLKALVGELSPFSVSYEVGAVMHPYEMPADERLPALLQQAFEQTAGHRAGYIYSSGGLDAGYLNNRGIKALMFGPGNLTFAHTDNDIVSLDECMEAAAVYAYTALAACGVGRPGIR